MLFELLGVDKYTTGIYVGGAFTTIRFPLTHAVALTFDPIHFAMPTVTTGVRRYQFHRDHRNPGPTSTEAERSWSRTHVAHGVRREPPGRCVRAPIPAPGSAWGDRASIGSAQSQEGPFSVEERRASMTRPPTSERPRGFTSLTLPVGEEPSAFHRVGPWSPVTPVELVPTLAGGDMPTPRPFGLPFYYKQYRVTFGVEVRL